MQHINDLFMMIDQNLQNFLIRYTIAIVFGLCIGSFLNVVIYRTPIILKNNWLLQSIEFVDEILQDQSIVDQLSQRRKNQKISLSFPASHCVHCKAKLKWWMNLPVLSYLCLRGRCRHCGIKISVAYPLIEISTAILFFSIALIYKDLWHLLAYTTFFSIVIIASVIDYNTMFLPDEITLPFLWLGILVNLQGFLAGSLLSSVLGVVVGYGFLATIYWLFKIFAKKDGMGFGDFKFLAALGAWLGVSSIIPIALVASLSAIMFAGISFIFVKKSLKEAIPFAPFLAIGAIASVLFANYLQPIFLI